MKLVLSQKIRNKLSSKNPPVNEDLIRECFANRNGPFLIDTREDHLTNPYTRWFIAETDYGRLLKICFIPHTNGEIHIKTAYDPNGDELRIYKQSRGSI